MSDNVGVSEQDEFQKKMLDQDQRLTKEVINQYKLPDDYWEDFKSDIGHKSLITRVDKGIAVRNSLIKNSDDPNAESKNQSLKNTYLKMRIFEFIATILYIVLCIFERPAWCINPDWQNSDNFGGYQYWYCQDPDNNQVTDDMFKLPAAGTNVLFSICLICMISFTLMRERFFRPNELEVKSRNVQIFLITLSVINYIVSLIFSQMGSQNNYLVYPWISSLVRPFILIQRNSKVRNFAGRYFSVMESSFPMVLLILVYVLYFSFMGERLFSDTIEGANSFYNLAYSFSSMFVLITTSNFPNVMLPSYNQLRSFCLFFLIFLSVGLFLLMNLLLAIFYSSYQDKTDAYLDTRRKTRSNFLQMLFINLDQDLKGYLDKNETRHFIDEIHCLAMEMEERPYGYSLKLPERNWNEMWRIIDKKNAGSITVMEIRNVFEAYEVQQYSASVQEQLELLFGEAEEHHPADFIGRLRTHTKLFYSPYYEMITNLFAVINCFTIALRDVFSYDKTVLWVWIGIQIFINFIFLVEMLLDFCTAGSPRVAFGTTFRLWPEVLCQVLNVYSIGFMFLFILNEVSYLKVLKYFESIIFLRIMKCLPLIYELDIMRVIIETLRNLMTPLSGLLVIVTCIFYFFAILGMFLFGGKITSDSAAIDNDPSVPMDFVLMNFNDICSSFVTQFALVVVNNWYVTVNANTDVVNSNWYRLYFLVFYYFGVLVGVNILVSFAIDMYTAVSRLDEIKSNNERFLIALARKYEKRQKKEKEIQKKAKKAEQEAAGELGEPLLTTDNE